jgi:OmpA-OmpF porin, OOP family
MTRPNTPPPAHRLGAVAVAAALVAFAGVAGAQVTNASGNPVRSTYTDCVQSGQQPASVCAPGSAARVADSPRVAQADSPRRATGPSASGAAAGSSAAAAGSTGAATVPSRLPGYATASDGSVVLSGFGNCVRAGHWTAANAAEPCDRIARADLPPPPVAAAPAPAPAVQPAPEPAPQPIAQPEPPRPVIQKLTLSTDVLFDFDKAELKDSGKQRLDQLADQIKDADVDEIVAVGHADRIASEGYNQKLSEARAQAVKDYLSQRGTKANTITAEGKGESQPVTGGDCQKMGPEKGSNKKLVACLAPDRRVEIEVLGSRQVAGTPPAGAGATGGAGSTSR